MLAMKCGVEPVASFLDGRWSCGGGDPVCLANPGDLDEVGACYWTATSEEARLAMDSASKAFPSWSGLSIDCRIDIMETLLAMVEENDSDFARIICRENGKPLREAMQDVSSGVADARHQLTVARNGSEAAGLKQGEFGIQVAERSEPAGVYLLITPWNFPLATILRKLVPALVFGNTAVVKPSELTPTTAGAMFKLLEELGLPSGVANLALGSGADLGPSLIAHEALRGISFTGSTENGLLIARSVAGKDVRLQLELGGNNALVVLADADLDAAAEAACVGGFSCSGQWCTGTGRVVVERSIYKEFCDRLVERARALRVGPGFEGSFEIGPLISKKRVLDAERIVEAALAGGAVLALGGKARGEINGYRGNFFEPTVLTKVSEESYAFQEELFLPILPVVEAADFGDAMRLVNSGRHGLSASIFTRSKAKGDAFLKGAQAGVVHVNLHTAYRRPDLALAAWRDSGRGYAECGRHAKDFFTRPRAVYAKY